MLETTATSSIHHKVTPDAGAGSAYDSRKSEKTCLNGNSTGFMRLTHRVRTHEDEPHFVLGYN